MRKYIIGTISGIDTPMSAADRSGREFASYMAQVKFETLVNERKAVLTTTVEKIRKSGTLNLRRRWIKINICVVGGKTAITRDQEILKEVKKLG